MFLILSICLLFLFTNSSEGYKVNITKFGNCEDVDGVKVNLTYVEYAYDADGLCDTVNGKYFVHTRDLGSNYELWLTVFQCPTNSTNQCNENAKKFVEPLDCTQFHEDSSGPWYMLAKAMKGSKCGEKTGEFKLESAQLLPEYLTKYFVFDPNLARRRLHMLFHKHGESGLNKYPRGCANIEFNVIN